MINIRNHREHQRNAINEKNLLKTTLDSVGIVESNIEDGTTRKDKSSRSSSPTNSNNNSLHIPKKDLEKVVELTHEGLQKIETGN